MDKEIQTNNLKNIENNDLKSIMCKLDDIYMQISIMRSEITDLKVRVINGFHSKNHSPQTSVSPWDNYYGR
jgi:hypothetical protein